MVRKHERWEQTTQNLFQIKNQRLDDRNKQKKDEDKKLTLIQKNKKEQDDHKHKKVKEQIAGWNTKIQVHSNTCKQDETEIMAKVKELRKDQIAFHQMRDQQKEDYHKNHLSVFKKSQKRQIELRKRAEKEELELFEKKQQIEEERERKDQDAQYYYEENREALIAEKMKYSTKVAEKRAKIQEERQVELENSLKMILDKHEKTEKFGKAQ